MLKHPWFLNHPFEQDIVFQQLSRMDYTHVLGMDIGGGESLLYHSKIVQRTDPNGKAYRAFSKPAATSDKPIPSMIGYRDQEVIIGSAAQKVPGFYQQFKVEPSRWNDPYRGRTYRLLMRDFIRKLWLDAVQKDPSLEEARQSGTLLFAVGCPASPAWTSPDAIQKYQRLIQSAVDSPHVAVLPESTAAIMSAILGANKHNAANPEQKRVVQLHRGIAIFDLGSITLDFTYVLLGKQLITKSLNVAGQKLDELILAQALKENGLDRSQIPPEQMSEVMIQIRQNVKEAFYPSQKPLPPISIDLWGRNADGTANPDLHSGLRIHITPDKTFMDKALHRQAPLRGRGDAPDSWLHCCQKFIKDCCALIGRDSQGIQLCDQIIMTGGTSNVHPLREAVEKIAAEDLGGCQVSDAENFSDSVAEGLCYAKALEIRGRSHLGTYRPTVEECRNKQYAAFTEGLSKYLSDQVCCELEALLLKHASGNDSIRVGQLLDELNMKVRRNPNLLGEPCKQKVSELFLQSVQTAHAQIHKKANAVSGKIYGAHLSTVPQIPPLTPEELQQMTSQLDIAGVINSSWASAVVNTIGLATIRQVLSSLGLFLLWPEPLLGGLLISLALLSNLTSIEQSITKFITNSAIKLSPSMMKKISENLTNPEKRKKLDSQSAEKTTMLMQEKDMLRKEFHQLVDPQAEILLGKLLFLVYDNPPINL